MRIPDIHYPQCLFRNLQTMKEVTTRFPDPDRTDHLKKAWEEEIDQFLETMR